MKPKVFGWRGAWYVSFAAGYDLGMSHPFQTWREALDYALGYSLW